MYGYRKTSYNVFDHKRMSIKKKSSISNILTSLHPDLKTYLFFWLVFFYFDLLVIGKKLFTFVEVVSTHGFTNERPEFWHFGVCNGLQLISKILVEYSWSLNWLPQNILYNKEDNQ